MPMRKDFLPNHTRVQSHVLYLINLGGAADPQQHQAPVGTLNGFCLSSLQFISARHLCPLLHDHSLHLAFFPVIILLHLDFSLQSSCFCCKFPEGKSHHRVGCTSIPWHRKASLGSQSP